MQKAKIRTDEEGLEAAAMTMVMMAEGAALEPEEPQFAKVCPAMVETVAELLEKASRILTQSDRYIRMKTD